MSEYPIRESDTILVCTRVMDLLDPATNSGKTFCQVCKKPVWIAPSGADLVAAKPFIKVVCFRCMPEVEARTGKPEYTAAPPGAYKEFEEAGAPPDLVAMVRYMEERMKY